MNDYKKYEPLFDKWYIKKKLGTGSFGEVYLIEYSEFDQLYQSALKVISIPQSRDEIRSMMADGTDRQSIAKYYDDVLESFAAENALMFEVRGNSHIVSYEDHKIIPHEDGIGYDILIRMELLTPLTEHLIHHKMDQQEVIRLGIHMCRALEICEQKGIIHRDIKPSNIFLSSTGNYKLGDFGIARTIEKTAGNLSQKGTPNYMAPEVYRGERYGWSVDIYSLGIVLYYLLNRKRTPFQPLDTEYVSHHDYEKALYRRMQGEELPPPIDADPALGDAVLKACAYLPRDRYGTAAEFREELERLAGDDSTAAGGSRAKAGGAADDTELIFDNPEDLKKYRVNEDSEPRRFYNNDSVYRREPQSRPYYEHADASWTAPGRGRIPPAAPRREKHTGRKIASLIAAILAALVFVGALDYFLTRTPNADQEGTVQATEVDRSVGEVPVEDQVELLSYDVNYDKTWKRGKSYANTGVDTLLLVRNDSNTPINHVQFSVETGDGTDAYNVNSSGTQFSADGYVGPGETGYMYKRIRIREDTDDSAGIVSIEGVSTCDLRGDYEDPMAENLKWKKRRYTHYTRNGEPYDSKEWNVACTLVNPNDETVHADYNDLVTRFIAAPDIDQMEDTGDYDISGQWAVGQLGKDIPANGERRSAELLDDPVFDDDKVDVADLYLYCIDMEHMGD